MLNKVIVMGRVVANVETTTNDREGGGQTVYAYWRLAVERDYKDNHGSRPVDYFHVKSWGAAAKFASQYYKKGDLVVVVGELRNEVYEKDGENRINTVIRVENTYPAHLKHVETNAPSVMGNESGFVEIPDGEELPFK